MQRIYKYPIKIMDEQEIELPRGAVLLEAQVQNKHLTLYAVVDEERPKVQQTIYVRGTGHPFNIDAAARFLGTVQFEGGALVFHVFAGRNSDGAQAAVWR